MGRIFIYYRCSCFPLLCGKREPQDDSVVFEDNCCQCNVAALREQVERGDVEVVFATYHVDVGQTPFFVAVDYTRRKVVLSIRGTLSMKDVITDLNAEGEPLPLHPPKEDWLGHKVGYKHFMHTIFSFNYFIYYLFY